MDTTETSISYFLISFIHYPSQLVKKYEGCRIILRKPLLFRILEEPWGFLFPKHKISMHVKNPGRLSVPVAVPWDTLGVPSLVVESVVSICNGEAFLCVPPAFSEETRCSLVAHEGQHPG